MDVHLFLACADIKPGDEIVEAVWRDGDAHFSSRYAPDEVTCERCIGRTIGRSPERRLREQREAEAIPGSATTGAAAVAAVYYA